jgi:hypothetical protein
LMVLNDASTVLNGGGTVLSAGGTGLNGRFDRIKVPF